jgi:hypothetical protein
VSDARHDGAIVRRAATEAGRTRPEIVQYVPCVARPERDEARRAVIPPLAAMLTAFWSLGETRPARRAAMVGRSGIPDSEFAAAIGRLRSGDDAERRSTAVSSMPSRLPARPKNAWRKWRPTASPGRASSR